MPADLEEVWGQSQHFLTYEIKVKILPQLRRSVFTVNAEKIGWSDEELENWVKTNMDTLNLEELLYAASLFNDNETKLAIYSKAMEKYPKCVRAANNVGVIKLKMGDLAGAKKALETAKSIKDHNIIAFVVQRVVAIDHTFKKLRAFFFKIS